MSDEAPDTGAQTSDVTAKDNQPDPFRLALLDDGVEFNLVLVRHGQQADRMVHDSPLSELGRRQAERVGEHLAGENVTAVYSSHLTRAHDTGLAIASQHGLECNIDERLQEIHIGRDVPEGKKMRDVLHEDELKERGQRFIDDRRWDSFAMSETGDELRARTTAALGDIRSADHEGTVVVACHGGVINAIIGHELGVSMDYFFKVAHCSVHRIRVGADRMVVEGINERHHLPGELFTY